MGRSHIIVSGLVWAAAAPVAAEAVGRPLSIPEIIGSTVICAGAAMIPDWDHPNASMAHSLGPVSKIIAKSVSSIAGGHRRGTHTAAFCVMMLATVGALLVIPGHVPSLAGPAAVAMQVTAGFLAFTFFLTLGLAFARAAWLGDGIYIVQAAALILWLSHVTPQENWWWLPFAVAAGCLLHCVEDALTVGGCPWFFRPFSTASLRFPVLGKTGDTPELIVATVSTAALSWVLLSAIAGHTWWSVTWLTGS